MREIKFRAWDGRKILQEGDKELDHIALTFDGKLVTAADTDLVYVDNNSGSFILMQFTGLKDRTGRDIFEGDIVKIQYWKEELPKYQPERNDEEVIPIKWVIAGFNIAPKYYLNNEVYEVIGNIYENPDLLTSPDNQ